MNVLIRESLESDTNFILSSWLKSFRNSQAVRGMDNEEYFTGQELVIKKILHKSITKVIVNPEDEDQILAYMTVETKNHKAIVHYIYVKQTFRGFGLATKLIKAFALHDPIYFSHMTPAAKHLSKKHNAKYNLYFM